MGAIFMRCSNAAGGYTFSSVTESEGGEMNGRTEETEGGEAATASPGEKSPLNY